MYNLRLLREERKFSQQKLAVEFDIAQSQIQNYETGGYQPDISVDFLLGRTDIRRKPEAVNEYDLNTKEQELVDRYRSLRPNQRQSLALFLDTLEDK